MTQKVHKFVNERDRQHICHDHLLCAFLSGRLDLVRFGWAKLGLGLCSYFLNKYIVIIFFINFTHVKISTLFSLHIFVNLQFVPSLSLYFVQIIFSFYILFFSGPWVTYMIGIQTKFKWSLYHKWCNS